MSACMQSLCKPQYTSLAPKRSPGLCRHLPGLFMLSILLWGTTGCSIKSQFIDLAYPDREARPSPERDWVLSLASTLVPWLTIGYDNPQAVGSCLEQLSVPPEALWSYGQCLARQQPTSACASLHLWPHLWQTASLSQPPPALRCTAAVQLPDQLRLAVAIADAGEALYSYNLSITGRLGDGETLDSRGRDAVQPALTVAARTLRAHPPISATGPDHLPSLSLSGGAANGAFTAGYLYALLLTREAAIAQAMRLGKPALVTRIERQERFEAATGTSAGSLAALIVDLYFSSNSDVPPATRTALTTCPAQAIPFVHESRPVQACALDRLRTDFIQDEWRLLCVVGGSVLDLFSNTTGALRFDPLNKNILMPFLRDFGEVMLHNDFLRLAMTIDLRQNVLMGLDERVCRWPEMDTNACLSAAVLASITEPVFAEPVGTVFAGVHGSQGEHGTWIDGGLRSGTPAARAVTLTRVRPGVTENVQEKVLAINTHRAEGIVSHPPDHAISVLFGSIGATVDQTRQWEMAYAQRLDPQRRERLCQVEQDLGLSGIFCLPRPVNVAATTVEPRAFPALRVNDGVLPVFVPEDIEPPELFAEGYTFDPVVMRGLFLWGQRVFLQSAPYVLSWLEWPTIRDLAAQNDAGPSLLTVMQEAVQAELRQFQAEVAPPGWWQRRRTERRQALERDLTTCR